jgi:hypothetical protein
VGLAFCPRLAEDSPTAKRDAAGVKVISNQRYFARRAVEETARARRACSPAAQSWHQELADKFGRLARQECMADERVPA